MAKKITGVSLINRNSQLKQATKMDQSVHHKLVKESRCSNFPVHTHTYKEGQFNNEMTIVNFILL